MKKTFCPVLRNFVLKARTATVFSEESIQKSIGKSRPGWFCSLSWSYHASSRAQSPIPTDRTADPSDEAACSWCAHSGISYDQASDLELLRIFHLQGRALHLAQDVYL